MSAAPARVVEKKASSKVNIKMDKDEINRK